MRLIDHLLLAVAAVTFGGTLVFLIVLELTK